MTEQKAKEFFEELSKVSEEQMDAAIFKIKNYDKLKEQEQYLVGMVQRMGGRIDEFGIFTSKLKEKADKYDRLVEYLRTCHFGGDTLVGIRRIMEDDGFKK